MPSTDGAADPGVFPTTDITPEGVNTAGHGSHLEAYLSGPGVRRYGVRVTHTY